MPFELKNASATCNLEFKEVYFLYFFSQRKVTYLYREKKPKP